MMTTMKTEKINNMLTKAFEENGTGFFEALNLTYTKASYTFYVNGANSFFECRKDMQIFLIDECVKELVALTPEDEESCHLIAYTLKLIEVAPSTKHFKGPIKVELKQLITDMNQLLKHMTSNLYIETKGAEYLEGFQNARKSSEAWKKILKLYNEIYNPHFDYIWK